MSEYDAEWGGGFMNPENFVRLSYQMNPENFVRLSYQSLAQ
jgi:hypothetical protein